MEREGWCGDVKGLGVVGRVALGLCMHVRSVVLRRQEAFSRGKALTNCVPNARAQHQAHMTDTHMIQAGKMGGQGLTSCSTSMSCSGGSG